MMTVVDVEKKERALRICERLAENDHIFPVKEWCLNIESKFIKVHPKRDEKELLKLFKDYDFDAKIYDRDYYITIICEKEVENLNMKDCFGDD